MQKNESPISPAKKRSSAKRRDPSITHPAQSTQAASSPAPRTPEALRDYWSAQGQPWRTEPEIDAKRQAELARQRTIVPDVEKGIYPFKGMKLNRADVEWLLATHENGRGPVDWSDESQRKREGLDLRGANLSQEKLSGLPLAKLCGGVHLLVGIDQGFEITEERRNAAAIQLNGTDLSKAQLDGADLYFAQMKEANFSGAHMERANLGWAQLEKAKFGFAFLEGASFNDANLVGANFISADLEKANLECSYLEGANLSFATLKRAKLNDAHLERINLMGARMEEARLDDAILAGADLTLAHLKNADLYDVNLVGAKLSNADLEGARIDRAILANRKGVSPQIVDLNLNGVNLTPVEWSLINMLGDEYEARKKRRGAKDARLHEYKNAVRANRQLASLLQNQGLDEDAARFIYRALALQRNVFWLQLTRKQARFRYRLRMLGSWLFSWFLFLLAGYGYKLWRSFFAYLIVIGFFMVLYHIVDPLLAWNEVFVVSMTAFHGRGFSPSTFSPGDWLSLISAVEAFVGLTVEVTFIATLTQRFFRK